MAVLVIPLGILLYMLIVSPQCFCFFFPYKFKTVKVNKNLFKATVTLHFKAFMCNFRHKVTFMHEDDVTQTCFTPDDAVSKGEPMWIQKQEADKYK